MSTTPKAKVVDVTPTEAETPKMTETPKTLEASVTNMKEGIAKATAGFEATQAKMKQGVEKAMKTAEELVAFNQGNIEALVKSSQIWASGMQDLSKHFAAAAQASLDESMSALKAMTSTMNLSGSRIRTLPVAISMTRTTPRMDIVTARAPPGPRKTL